MIYICYIIYSDYAVTCVLTVRDNELAVGDDDDASSDTCGSAQGTHVVGQPATRQAGSGLPALPGDRGKKKMT
jgi:hypothetical protein